MCVWESEQNCSNMAIILSLCICLSLPFSLYLSVFPSLSFYPSLALSLSLLCSLSLLLCLALSFSVLRARARRLCLFLFLFAFLILPSLPSLHLERCTFSFSSLFSYTNLIFLLLSFLFSVCHAVSLSRSFSPAPSVSIPCFPRAHSLLLVLSLLAVLRASLCLSFCNDFYSVPSTMTS